MGFVTGELSFSFSGDDRKSIMIVNAFVVDGFYGEGIDAFVGKEESCRIPDDIFHEHWIFVCLHGDVAFIRPFKQCVNRCRTGFFRYGNEVFDEDEFAAAAFGLGSHFQRDVSALVVSAVVTDFFATRA